MKTNTRHGADFELRYQGEEFIVIADSDIGNKSVTNDAEAVVEVLLKDHSDRRIYYFDSDGRLDELQHDGRRFTGFGAGIPADFQNEYIEKTQRIKA